jgi:hypothetical protein
VSRNTDISIEGDGNVVGDNNRVLVDKRVYNKVINQGGGGGGGGSKKSGGEGDGIGLAGLGLAAVVALAVAAWGFALFAPLIYLGLLIGSLAVASCLCISLMVGLYGQVGWKWLAQKLVALVAVALLIVGVYWSRLAYRDELSDMAARAADWKGFFCNLSAYGQQLATLHMLSMSLFAAPCLLILSGYALGALSASVFFMQGWLWCGRLALTLSTPMSLWTAAVLAAGCMASQTEPAAALWDQMFTRHLQQLFVAEQGRVSVCPAAVGR